MAERDAKGHWLPGTSGNPNGRPRDPFSGLIDDKLREARGDATRAEIIAEQLVSKAESGERWAIEYLYDRYAGKPRQAMDIVADVNEAVGITIVRAGDGADTDTTST